MRLISFPVTEDRADEVLDMQRLFGDDYNAWDAGDTPAPWLATPAIWTAVAHVPDPEAQPGDTITLMHRPATGGVALLYREAHCLECQTGCTECVFVCRVEVTVADLLRGIERGIAQGSIFAGWVTPEAEVRLLRGVLTGLYDEGDPTEAAEQTLVALGGPIKVLPRAAF